MKRFLKTHGKVNGQQKPKRGFAQVLLVNYLNRNLSQIGYTFWLSVFVMIVGFGILVWGISKVFNSPNSILSAMIVSVAGVITEFIGATFLLIYRSTQQQAEKYFKTLERISTSEIAEEIARSVPKALRDEIKAKVVKSMIEEIYKKE